MNSRMDMYALDGDAGLTFYKSVLDLPSGYTKMAAGNFGVSGGANLLCYNAETGQGDIWLRDADGVFSKVATEPSLCQAPGFVETDLVGFCFCQDRDGRGG